MKPQRYTISCDICQDLIPLVEDGVASSDSANAVREHIAGCGACSSGYAAQAAPAPEASVPDDRKIIAAIRRQLFLIALAILVCGALIGIYLSNSFGMYYNLLIMPVIGGMGYMLLKRRWYAVPVILFAFTYAWQFAWSLYDGAMSDGWQPILLTAPLFYCFIYSALSALGVLVAALLHYAFRKEK